MDRKRFDIRCGSRRLRLGGRTEIMGVLNITPDSFSDGGFYYNKPGTAARKARQMLEEGASIIDIGGESTRPGSEPVSAKEELRRVIPVIKSVRRLGKDFFISVDTYKAEVAEKALLSGADIVNALSGFEFDSEMPRVVRRFRCPIILYHIRGRPKTMQKTVSSGDVMKEIRRFFMSQMRVAKAGGISKSQLLIDPGIGFGKSLEQNLEIVRKLDLLSSAGLPIVVGMSRKSHLGKLLQQELGLSYMPTESERLEAALAETAVAVMKGAHVIRTHDVLQTRKFVAALDALV